ncbi:MAG: hypothetical protein ACLQGP_21580 [Isosphaeraceae bacterium]
MSITTSEKSISAPAADLIEQIESRIRRRVGGRLSCLNVAIQGGGLVLRGRTLTHHAKQLALQAAMESTELTILANEIRVGQDPGLDEPRAVGSPGGRSPEDATRKFGKTDSETMSLFFARIAAIWFRSRAQEG